MKKAFALLLVSAVTFSSPAWAQTPSSEEIVKALEPKPITRSLRGITVEGDDKPPSIDLHIQFEFDSDKLTNEGLLSLQRLGNALKDPRLTTYRFKIAGHTDAVGSADYNQKLSERRAASVKNHLVSKYGLDAGRVESAGYGKTQLLDASKPDDGINRRVQVINLGESK